MSEQTPKTRARPQTKPLRRLLPAGAAPSSPPAAETSAGRTPKIVRTACLPCRQAKAKCSGQRPVCSRCVQRHVLCRYGAQRGKTALHALTQKYSALQSRAAIHDDLIELLRGLEDSEAQVVLQKLRSGTDAATILSHVKTGNILLQMAVSPETRFRYEFPYRSEMPEDYDPDSPYLKSLVYEAASLYSAGQSPRSLEHADPASTEGLSSHEHRSLYLKPFHAAQVVDSRLTDAKLSSWTTVCDDDMLMRDLLGVFLRCEYQFTAAFQKDLFLDDLAAQRSDFCSSLLVNMILAYSCICYPKLKDRAEYWNPHSLTYRFFAEAKRIWELEATSPRITTIQAGILFSVFYNLSGLDEIGQAYRIQAVVLAQRLRLFDNTVDDQRGRISHGRAFTAWALYNWETLAAFSFMFPPLLGKPPSWPLPDPAHAAQWYGEVWVKYPLNRAPSPLYFGHVFRARSEFRVVMNEFCRVAYSQGSEVTLDKANDLRSKLQRWYDGLPAPLQPRAIVLPGHMQLHMYYHFFLLTIYEPLLGVKTARDAAPEQIVAKSSKHMQTLLRLYYLRHGFEAMNLFIVVPIMLIASECIEAIDEKTPAPHLEVFRSTLILVAKGLYDQRRNHYLAEALYRVIRGRMRPQEVALLRETVSAGDEETDEKRQLVQAVRSHWPVSVVKNKEDMHSHILTGLVESYGHLNVD